MILHQYAEASLWLDAMVEGWQTLGGAALSARGTFHVSLSGGSTPQLLYQRLAQLSWPWAATTLYLGDERWVDPAHKDSNYRMIHQAFAPTGVQIERVRTEIGTAEIGAREYEKRIRTGLGDPPRFDLVLLGLGDDGHTASLFPDTLALAETKLLFAPNYIPKLGVWRVTATYTLLRYARAIWFVTRGPLKEPYLPALLAEDPESPTFPVATFPAAKVRSDRGTVEIYHCNPA